MSIQEQTVTLSDIFQAGRRLGPYVKHTPMLRAEALDEEVGCRVWLKPECLQKTGSFKLRGATNKILTLTEQERARGIIASSSGNHGLGVAYASHMLGVQATLVLPTNAPQVKVEGAKALGARVIQFGYGSIERYKKLYEIQAEEGQTLVHSFDDPMLIAGQATAGLEIACDMEKLDAVVVPLGGGGLLAGVAAAVKELRPDCRVIGVEPAAIPRYSESRRQGRPVEVEMKDTVADGLMLTKTGSNNWPLIQKYVDDIVAVEDASIYRALQLICFGAKLTAEPSAAIGIAACLAGKLNVERESNVCFLLTGGNVDQTRLFELLGRGCQ